ncbi:MAG: helix-turn-helix domain-containing protein [Bacilli bacterium]|nr:helix-turn-helix domain-containing protein [Bacilli bacterium]
MNIEDKKVYEIKEIKKILGLKESTCYDFIRNSMKQNLFTVLKIGRQYRVNKKSFDDWFNGVTNEEIEKLSSIC